MKPHLKTHPVQWGQYKNCRDEKYQSKNTVPAQSLIQIPFLKERLDSTIETKDKAWTYFEEDESIPRGLLCQVGECTFKHTQDTNGPWSLGAVKKHLYTHGYKE